MGELRFHLPDIGEGLTEAEIIEWKVGVGDHVVEHQTVVAVETDKARVELPAPASGTVVSLGAEEGDVLQVGAVLMTIAAEELVSAEHPMDEGDERSDASPEARPPAKELGAMEPSAGERPQRTLAAPSTRRLARELDVELGTIVGSGPNGRIVDRDVRAAAARPLERGSEPESAREFDRPQPLRGLRRAMARSMTAAWNIPHITELREVDATGLVRVQRALRESAGRHDLRFGFAPLLVKITAAALAAHPGLNATFDPDEGLLTVHRRANVGVAMDTPDGLMVPVVRDVAVRSVLEVAREIHALGEAARERKLSPDQLSGGSFTVTNTGAYGGQFGTPMLRPPEVAIAGFGRTADAVAAVDGQPVVRPALPISVSVDHRVVTGGELGRFITTIEELVGDPELLLLGAG